MSYIAAMMCLYLEPYEAFQAMANLMVREHLFVFYLMDCELVCLV